MKKFSFFISLIIYFINSQSYEIDKTISVIRELLNITAKFYVDTINYEEIKKSAIIGILDELDPHSIYIPKEEVQKSRELLKGGFEGIGIEFQILDDTVWVVHVLHDGPAYKAGLKSGDKIIKVDTVQIAGKKLLSSDIQKLLRGPKGTTVNVKILRDSDTLWKQITRDNIPIQSVVAVFMLDSSTGYIKLARFSEKSDKEMDSVLTLLKKQGASNFIIDLMDNTGGYLNVAVEIASFFVPPGELIVYTKDRYGQIIKRFSKKKNLLIDSGKVVIIIDENSASASEILSGALQDLDKSLIVGRRSFGKALVQQEFQLPDSSIARITIATYYTPSGRPIQKPYKNKREYLYDIALRYKTGELFHKDSIKIPQDKQFYSLFQKRKLPAGGGIVPDVFVPLDTSFIPPIFRKAREKRIIPEFPIKFVNAHRKKFQECCSNKEKFDTIFNPESTLFEKALKEFTEKLLKANIDTSNFSKQLPQIALLLKAEIALYLFRTEGYYYVLRNHLPEIKKALECIHDNTFKELGILEKTPK